MRHKLIRHRFNRFTSWRTATLRSLARSVLIYQSIKTTKVKAMAVKPLVEKLITLAKQNTLDARRRAFAILNDHALVTKLFGEIGTRFAGRTGGYTRVLNYGTRRGDGAQMAVLELTEIKKEKKAAKKKAKDAKAEEAKGGKAAAHEEIAEGVIEKKHKEEPAPKEKSHPEKEQKPTKNFLGGLRGIFKKERDSL
jgi:large subunit ribosomal protein L17